MKEVIWRTEVVWVGFDNDDDARTWLPCLLKNVMLVEHKY
jgi:hypothetical protein